MVDLKQKIDMDFANKLAESAEIFEICEAIGAKFGLHIDQVGELDSEIRGILAGINKPADFVDHLIKRLEINRKSAEQITVEANDLVFKLVKTMMQNPVQEAGTIKNLSSNPTNPITSRPFQDTTLTSQRPNPQSFQNSNNTPAPEKPITPNFQNQQFVATQEPIQTKPVIQKAFVPSPISQNAPVSHTDLEKAGNFEIEEEITEHKETFPIPTIPTKTKEEQSQKQPLQKKSRGKTFDPYKFYNFQSDTEKQSVEENNSDTEGQFVENDDSNVVETENTSNLVENDLENQKEGVEDSIKQKTTITQQPLVEKITENQTTTENTEPEKEIEKTEEIENLINNTDVSEGKEGGSEQKDTIPKESLAEEILENQITAEKAESEIKIEEEPVKNETVVTETKKEGAAKEDTELIKEGTKTNSVDLGNSEPTVKNVAEENNKTIQEEVVKKDIKLDQKESITEKAESIPKTPEVKKRSINLLDPNPEPQEEYATDVKIPDNIPTEPIEKKVFIQPPTKISEKQIETVDQTEKKPIIPSIEKEKNETPINLPIEQDINLSTTQEETKEGMVEESKIDLANKIIEQEPTLQPEMVNQDQNAMTVQQEEQTAPIQENVVEPPKPEFAPILQPEQNTVNNNQKPNIPPPSSKPRAFDPYREPIE